MVGILCHRHFKEKEKINQFAKVDTYKNLSESISRTRPPDFRPPPFSFALQKNAASFCFVARCIIVQRDSIEQTFDSEPIGSAIGTIERLFDQMPCEHMFENVTSRRLSDSNVCSIIVDRTLVRILVRGLDQWRASDHVPDD